MFIQCRQILSRCLPFIPELSCQSHSVDQSAILIFLSFPIAFVPPFFIDHQKYSDQFIFTDLFADSLTSQKIGFMGAVFPVLCKYGMIIYKSNFSEYPDQLIPPQLVPVCVAAHTPIHPSRHIGRNILSDRIIKSTLTSSSLRIFSRTALLLKK